MVAFVLVAALAGGVRAQNVVVLTRSSADDTVSYFEALLATHSIPFTEVSANQVDTADLDHKVIIAGFSSEPLEYAAVGNVIGDAVKNGSWLVAQAFGGYILAYAGIGSAGTIGWAPATLDKYGYVAPIDGSRLFLGVSTWDPPETPDRPSQYKNEVLVSGAYLQNCSYTPPALGVSSYRYWAIAITYGWSGQNTSSSYCASWGGCTPERSVNMSEIQVISVQRGKAIAPWIGAPVVSGIHRYGPIADQIHLNAIQWALSAVTSPGGECDAVEAAPALVVTPEAPSSMRLQWTAVLNATSYTVYRDDSVITTTQEFSFVDTNLEPGTQYCYTVRGTNSCSEGPFSEQVCAMTDSGPLDAAFEWSPDEPAAGETVAFTDLSTGPVTGWLWDFGDGTSSAEQHPTHVYQAAGSYDVTLTVSDDEGTTASVTHTVQVHAASTDLDFTWTPAVPAAHEAVSFLPEISIDCVPLAWQWDFGDGFGSVNEEPVHVFQAAGEYQVTVTATFQSTGCPATLTAAHAVVVQPPGLSADFVFHPGQPRVGEPVQFFDVSQGEPDQRAWDFGDGYSSTDQNPTHSFAAPGTYAVTLTVGWSFDPSSSSSITREVVVSPETTIDFGWSPESPGAWEPVTFSPRAPGEIESLLWDFGDDETSHETRPVHVYEDSGRYTVGLWASLAGGGTAYAEHVITVAAPPSQVELVASTDTPAVGETVDLTLQGAPEIESVQWDLQDPDCGGASPFFVCTSNSGTDCRHIQWRWSSQGIKSVQAWIVVGGETVGPFAARVVVSGQGSCGLPPQAQATWWPASPHAGEPVQFVDRSSGSPETWIWNFGDGHTSSQQHPRHVFDEPGTYTVSLEAANQHGSSTTTVSIQVGTAQPVCGDGVCEDAESSWSCPQDCGSGPLSTGRADGSGTELALPAVASRTPGVNGTVWSTEGTFINTGETPARLVARFLPDEEGEEPVSRTLILPERSGIHLADLAGSLFDITGLGSLLVSSDQPVILDTRTFNTASGGTFGQQISGVPRRRTLGAGEGRMYLLGVKETPRFRTNLLIQEISGRPASVRITMFDRAGLVTGESGPMEIPPESRKLIPLGALGEGFEGHGYCTVETEGEGRLAVIGSVVDQHSGDAVTVGAVHPTQLVTTTEKRSAKDTGTAPVTGEGRYLVAVVTHTPGLNNTFWRSELVLLNPQETLACHLRLLYIPDDGQIHTSSVTLKPGEEFSSSDVVNELFPEAGDGSGALHIATDLGVAIDSRTYTVVDQVSGATAGQAIPGLASGDLVHPGEVGVISGLRSTDDFRCNLGFTEFEGSDTRVTVTLFDTSAGVMRYLATKTYSIPAYQHLQVTRVFHDMGLEDRYPEVLATVVVAGDTGVVYAYASIVDNQSGDATTILPKKE